MPSRPLVYSGAADRQLELYCTPGNFMRSLVYGTLLRGDLAVTDVFFYISNRIAKPISKGSRLGQYILAGVTSGAIRPAFRREARDFQTNLSHVREDGTQGLLKSAETVAAALQKAIEGRPFEPVFWPEEKSSVRFRGIVERTFLNELPPDDRPEIAQFWEQTKSLRLEAIGHSKLDDYLGFKRGNIYNSLAAQLGSPLEEVGNNADIWGCVDDRRSARRVQRLVKWLDYTYQYSQARFLELEPALVGVDDFDLAIVKALNELSASPTSSSRALRTFVEVPSLEALLTIEPARLTELRCGEAALDYFNLLRAYQTGADNAPALLESLDAYGNELCKMYVNHGSPVRRPFTILSATSDNSVGSGQCARDGAAVLLDAAGLALQLISDIMFICKVGKLIYSRVPYELKELLFKKGFTKLQVEIDVKNVSIRDPRPSKASFEAQML